MGIKAVIKALLGPSLIYKLKGNKFSREGGSMSYWENRYAQGGTSGDGSYDKLAQFKAEIIQKVVREQGIRSTIELGCGDGNNLSITFPQGSDMRYLGFDVSKTAVQMCANRFKDDPNKDFIWFDTMAFSNRCGFVKADAAMSLDVLYHLVEDEIYEKYMALLFGMATKCVIIYSVNQEQSISKDISPHCIARKFTDYIDRIFTDWELTKHIPNKYPIQPDGTGSWSDFFVYGPKKQSTN